MRRARLVLVATIPLAVLLLSARPAYSVVDINADLELEFTDACAPTDGFVHAGLDPDGPFEPDGLFAVSWSSEQPLIVSTLAPQTVSDSGELQVAPFFAVLVAADRKTILYQGEFRLVDPFGPERSLKLKALLDCSVVPYRVVGSSDTAVATGGPPLTSVVGVVLLVLATLLLIDRQTRWLRPSEDAWIAGRRDIDPSSRGDARTEVHD